MDFEQSEFITRAKSGVVEWNKWAQGLKKDNPNQRLKVEFTASDSLREFIGFNGFEGYDFSLFQLHFTNIQFANIPEYNALKEVTFLKNVKGLSTLYINECYGLLPSIWIEGAEIEQISIGGSDPSTGGGGTRINSITLKNCSIQSIGVMLSTLSIDRLWVENCCFIGDKTYSSLQVRDVIFNYILYLDYSLFNSLTTFKNCEFKDLVQIANVEFRGYVEFTNCNFQDRTDFQHTVFVLPPRFNGSLLNSQTLFPPEENFKVIKNNDKRFVNVHVSAFQLLKTEASKLLDRRTQGMFFSLEQKYLLLSDRMSLFEKFISYVYQISSNYGRSIFKPVLGLFILFILYTLSYAAIKSEVISYSLPFSKDIFIESVRLSLGSIFTPFRVLLEKDTQISLVLLSISQSLLSIGLVTVSLLAVRWNFRRD